MYVCPVTVYPYLLIDEVGADTPLRTVCGYTVDGVDRAVGRMVTGFPFILLRKIHR